MTEYIALALLGFVFYQDFMNRKERKRLIDAFLAKSLRELREPEQVKPSTSRASIPDIPLDAASPEEFDKAIKKTLEKETIMEKAAGRLKGIVKRKPIV